MVFRTFLFLSAVLLLVTPIFAREKSDTIVLKNGDHLTFEIQNLAMGLLYVTDDDVDGTIRIRWSEVERVESSHLFIIRTQDGSVYIGALSTGRKPAADRTRFVSVRHPVSKYM